jgi:NAD(P)-dependent dehydrogenase (short-subunit alcohol dehydrogenase family)
MTAPTLTGRRALVTGATDGIGLHTATALARLGADVTLVARDPARGHSAAQAIAGQTGSRAVRFLPRICRPRPTSAAWLPPSSPVATTWTSWSTTSVASTPDGGRPPTA